MNNGLSTSFERMVCGVGHRLIWEGRWRHVNHEVELLWEAYGGCPKLPPHNTTAVFPRTYYKR